MMRSHFASRLAAVAIAAAIPAGIAMTTGASPAMACAFTAATCGAPATLRISPTSATLVAGSTASFTAGYGVATFTDVTAGATFTMDGGTCTANTCTSSVAGVHAVTASYQGVTASAAVTVLVPDHLAISPVFTEVAPGQPVSYAVARMTADGTYIDDVTARATVTLDGTACPQSTCSATAVGEHLVTATLGSLTGGGALTVVPGPAVRLSVTADTTLLVPGLADTFHAEAYDAAGNDLGDVSSQASFSIEPEGSCNANLCTATLGLPHTVVATLGSASGTLDVTVEPPIPAVIPSLPAGRLGQPYSQNVLVSSDPTTTTQLSSGTTLPPGLSLASDGTLSGTPTSAGTFSFGVTVNNVTGGSNKPTTITIGPASTSLPQVRVGNRSTLEGNKGRHVVQVPITLSAASRTPVTVSWTTRNGTATAGSDYLSGKGTATFPAGTLTVTVPVTVLGDTLKELNETLQIVVTNPVGATIGHGIGIVTIRNDD